jgi:hypothetical protein
MYECHGMDKTSFSYFSLAFSQVSLSVRTEVGAKKKLTDKDKHTQIRSRYIQWQKIKRDRWHNLMEISMCTDWTVRTGTKGRQEPNTHTETQKLSRVAVE